jgi:hypoxanthine phosphoribosyltransferase
VRSETVGEVLFSAEQIASRIRELGEAISRDYAERDLVLAGVLRGAAFFLVDLARALTIPAAIDFIAISSYGPNSKASGVVRIVKDLEEEIAGRHLLVVEDIVDTGLTLGYLLRILRERGPASLQVCALLDRSMRRIVDHPIAYRGFEVPDRFVVGYGLDYQQRYRSLPFIALLNPAG